VSETFFIPGISLQTIGHAFEHSNRGSSRSRAGVRTMTNTILVIGTTGKAGKRAADQLLLAEFP
jgi:hypothetical protein